MKHYCSGNDGRAFIRAPDGTKVYVAQLSAVAAGYDPEKVFSEKYESHHVDENTWNDAITNIALLNRENHRGLHALKNAIRNSEARS